MSWRPPRGREDCWGPSLCLFSSPSAGTSCKMPPSCQVSARHPAYVSKNGRQGALSFPRQRKLKPAGHHELFSQERDQRIKARVKRGNLIFLWH